ncbi:PREDICTED: UBP1-associated proteins 1C-like [Tarenaya hassleriana]|uniref:UBP1-associated proteins 1C-like n=1 Tax=Tarenaya hassleriana TaxID=28532 RepID=UPI00053C7FFD|nr:PREDICTED: UBP1-associated proteins 1C-like [Tarenaya hassleriana]XP_010548657.1 PREDICTED: UBP1-associated proteins 1C-like [Tarenaya hassleriana]
MVWFQCEDCGENLKKPKLPNHFRICSAAKLSCIDCGEIFGQHSVQGHNQCISEAEKYGPKGQLKPSNCTPAKSKQDSKQQPDFDVNVGLSDRPPWFCRLCNTKATSQQTLLLHADGKKHRAKAKAFHAKQQPQSEQSAGDEKDATGNASSGDAAQKKKDLPAATTGVVSSNDGNGDSLTNKKRKLESSDGTGNEEVIQAEQAQGHEKKSEPKKAKKKGDEKKIKWKKLIKLTLKSQPGRALKMKKLKKLVLKSLEERGITRDASEINEKIEHKINSSSKFAVDGKHVKLLA